MGRQKKDGTSPRWPASSVCVWVRQVLRGWEEPVPVELRAMTPAQPGGLPACSRAHSDTHFPIPLTPVFLAAHSLWLLHCHLPSSLAVTYALYSLLFPSYWLKSHQEFIKEEMDRSYSILKSHPIT